jgi:ribosomal protein S18 acetylase RimI-like enzyme
MAKILNGASATALVRAIEANELERFAYMSRRQGGELHRGPHLTWFLTGIPYLLFNGILSARLPSDDLDRRVAHALAPFVARKLPMFWMTGPSTQPKDLGQRLLAAGLSEPGELVGMAVDLATAHEDMPAPPGLTIQRVSDQRTLARWVEAHCAGSGSPADVGRHFLEVLSSLSLEERSPLVHYLGLVAGEPVATASAFLGAGVVGIYSIATLPAWRRQGIGGAMTMAPLRNAQARDYQIGILHAEPAGLSLYHHLGFREYCALRPYLWSPGLSGE